MAVCDSILLAFQCLHACKAIRMINIFSVPGNCVACHVCRPNSASAFYTEFSALFSWVRPVLVSSPQCDGSDLEIFFFSFSFPPCVGWGVAPSRCFCGLGGWWWGENRGSGSALAANSAFNRVSSQELGTPAADFAQDRVGSWHSAVR